MAGRNGTGPMGQGPMTGRGLGNCPGTPVSGYGFGNRMGMGMRMGRGPGCGIGYGRNFYQEPIAYKSQKDFLADQREYLKNRLDIINSQLEDLAETDK